LEGVLQSWMIDQLVLLRKFVNDVEWKCLERNVTKNVTKISLWWDFLEIFWNIYTNPQEGKYCYLYL